MEQNGDIVEHVLDHVRHPGYLNRKKERSAAVLMCNSVVRSGSGGGSLIKPVAGLPNFPSG